MDLNHLDTTELPLAQRDVKLAAWTAAIHVPMRIACEEHAFGSAHHLWSGDIAPGVTVVDMTGDAARLRILADPSGRVVAAADLGDAVGPTARECSAPDLPARLKIYDGVTVDSDVWPTSGRTRFVAIDRQRLAMTRARRAASVGEAYSTDNPLLPLTLAHLRTLPDLHQMTLLSAHVRSLLADAAVELIRAYTLNDSRTATRAAAIGPGLDQVTAEAAAGSTSPRSESAERLRRHVVDFIERELHDPALAPSAIARAHHVSVRTLHKAWGANATPLAESITAARLERARRSLATDPDTAVAQIARRSGFINPAHFSRRFREEFGMTPNAWRRTVWHGEERGAAPRA